MDTEGSLRCASVSTGAGLTFSDRSYFQNAIEGHDFVVGEYTINRFDQRQVLPLAVPVTNDDGGVIGVVSATLDLAWISRELLTRGIPAGGNVTLADRNGVILARQPAPDAVRRHPDSRCVHASRLGAGAGRAGTDEPGRNAAYPRLRARRLPAAGPLCQRGPVRRRSVRFYPGGDASFGHSARACPRRHCDSRAGRRPALHQAAGRVGCSRPPAPGSVAIFQPVPALRAVRAISARSAKKWTGSPAR